MSEKRLTPVARKLRREATDAERKLWHRLKGRQVEGAKFVRQLPIGPHIADFACRAARLVVELDGGHHAERTAEDAGRTEVIGAYGFRVIRFWNNEIARNIDGVVDTIRDEILLGRMGDNR